MTTYSNPRTYASIENWPHGSQRVTAVFTIEADKRGERAVRVTTGAPKKLTYARQMRIVDGDDGRTYIAERSFYDHVTIMRGDMKFNHETIHRGDPRYPEMLKLFETRHFKPIFLECGCCGGLHKPDMPIGTDCRDDTHRFAYHQLDAQFGLNGWTEITLDDQAPLNWRVEDFLEEIRS